MFPLMALKIKNPFTAIARSEASRGLKLIAYSLLLVFVTSLPFMLTMFLGPEESNPVFLGRVFAGGALVAHVGFLVGLLMLIWDSYFGRR